MARNRPLDPVGAPTAAIGDGKRSTASGEYFAARTMDQFAPPRAGNDVVAYTDGRSAMAAMADAIRAAEKFIFIADWQMNYDVELDGRGTREYRGRLSELLREAVNQRGVDVRVLLYDSVEVAAYTHENEARDRLNAIWGDKSVGRVEVGLHQPATGRSDLLNIGFSHHQKILVVDGRYAFIGGLDVAHGRWDCGNFDVVADPEIHVINDHYNGAYVRHRGMTDREKDLIKDVHMEDGSLSVGFAAPYYASQTIAVMRLQTLWNSGAAMTEVVSYSDKLAIPENVEEYAKRKVIEEALEEVLVPAGLVNGRTSFFVICLLIIKHSLSIVDGKYAEAWAAQSRALGELGDGNVRKAIKHQLDAVEQLFTQRRDELYGKRWETIKKALDAGFRMSSKALDRVGDYVGDPGLVIEDAKWLCSEAEQALDEAKQALVDARKAYDDIVSWINTPLNLDMDQLLLDSGRQPRMPWQDVHCRIEGPAAFDVFRNYVRRWNAMVHQNQSAERHVQESVDTFNRVRSWLPSDLLGITIPEAKKPEAIRLSRGMELTYLDRAWFKRQGGKAAIFGDLTKPGQAGQMVVQVLRSAGTSLLGLETRGVEHAKADVFDGNDKKSIEAEKKRFSAAADKATVTIQDAMLHCIASAKAYIYIESQFFISDCGSSSSELVPQLTAPRPTPDDGGTMRFKPDVKSPATNCLIEAVADRVDRAIHAGQDFHVYMTLPVHPEGAIDNGAVVKQQYWLQQSLLRGEGSLIRRICRSLVMKELGRKESEVREYEIRQMLVDLRWQKYLSVMNLRSFGVLQDQVAKGRDGQFKKYLVTEQCYVHSKLLIVDDAVAIIGSANCNDRSLNGNGDSEIAAVIVDGKSEVRDLGNGVPVVTRAFARDLRLRLWKKFLGMMVSEDVVGKDKGYTRKVMGDELHPPYSIKSSLSIDLEKPASAVTVRDIREIAENNADAFESVFQHVARNSMGRYTDILAGFPQAGFKMDGDLKVRYRKLSAEPPALQEQYMKVSEVVSNGFTTDPGEHDVSKGFRDLKENLKGFWVKMPLDWGHAMPEPSKMMFGALIAQGPGAQLPDEAQVGDVIKSRGAFA